MFCPNCGQQNPAEAKFCGHCGATISGPDDAREATPAAAPNDRGQAPAGQWTQPARPSTTSWGASPPPAPPVTPRPTPEPAVRPPPQWSAGPPSQASGQWLVGNESATVGSGEGVSNGLNIAVIIGSIIIPFIGLVAGVVYMADSNPAKKSAGKVWLIVGIISAVVWVVVAL
jgi:hypothetical protein